MEVQALNSQKTKISTSHNTAPVLTEVVQDIMIDASKEYNAAKNGGNTPLFTYYEKSWLILSNTESRIAL